MRKLDKRAIKLKLNDYIFMKRHCNCLQEDIVLQEKYIEKKYNINHYTELEDSNLPPLGSRVRRKPGWRYGDQDKGRPGTVVGHHKGSVE